MNKYGCDHCDDDLTLSRGTTKFRLTLSSTHLHHNNIATIGVYIHPPIERDYHFCGLSCLKKWLDK